MHRCQEETRTCSKNKTMKPECLGLKCLFRSQMGRFYFNKRAILLEFDLLLIQEVDIKEPCEEQVQTTERIKYQKDIFPKKKLQTIQKWV